MTPSRCPLCKSKKINLEFQGIDYSFTKERFDVYECSGCSVSFTMPYLNEKDISKYYNKKNYQSFKGSTASFFDIIYNLVRDINSHNKLKAIKDIVHGDLLDYGSGSGFFAKYLRKKNITVYEYEPINNSSNKWMITNKVLHKKKNCFSAVTLWHVLEHVNDPVKELLFIKKLLKKRSHIVVAMPNTSSYDNSYYGKYWAGYDLPRHRFHFNPTAFSKLCDKVGLKIKSTIPMYYDSYYISILSEKNKQSIFSFIKGLYIGFISNLKAKKTKNYSSLIYVLEN